jgi:hypothetical protein
MVQLSLGSRFFLSCRLKVHLDLAEWSIAKARLGEVERLKRIPQFGQKGQLCQCGRLKSSFRGTGRDTTIYQKCVASYITAGFGGKKDHRSVEIVRPPWPFDGYTIL